jgi:hypothetical protein
MKVTSLFGDFCHKTTCSGTVKGREYRMVLSEWRITAFVISSKVSACPVYTDETCQMARTVVMASPEISMPH